MGSKGLTTTSWIYWTKSVWSALVPSGKISRAGYVASKYSAMMVGPESMTGFELRVGSTITGRVYTGLPFEPIDVGGAPMDRIFRSISGKSTQTVL